MPRSVIARFAALLSSLALAAVPLVAQAQEQTLDQSVTTQNQIVKEAAATQARINSLSQQTQQLLTEYLVAKQQVDQLQQYNDNLQGLINDQQARIASLKNQLLHITDVEHGIVPLMQQMITGLENFIQLDTPFHREDRLQRAQELQDLMTNSDVTISEKYRQIMAAYQAEIDYGKTVEAYRAPLTVNGQEQSVQFLRIGRVSFCYQTLNQSQTGCWNNVTDQWVANGGFRRNVAHGLGVARKQTTPSLLILPVVAPQAPLSVPPAMPETQPAPQPAPAPQTQAAAAPQTPPAPQSQS